MCSLLTPQLCHENSDCEGVTEEGEGSVLTCKPDRKLSGGQGHNCIIVTVLLVFHTSFPTAEWDECKHDIDDDGEDNDLSPGVTVCRYECLRPEQSRHVSPCLRGVTTLPWQTPVCIFASVFSTGSQNVLFASKTTAFGTNVFSRLPQVIQLDCCSLCWRVGGASLTELC